jgi:hypothetical protein
MKRIFATIILLIIIIFSINAISKDDVDFIDIDGVWRIVDKIPDFIRFLKIKEQIDNDSSFCVDMSTKRGTARIYFYNHAKIYEVQVLKSDTNEYKLLNENRELKFNANSRKQRNGSKVVHLGIYDRNGKLTYTEHGKIYCLDSIQGLNEAKCGDRQTEIEMCLKDAKAADDYFKRDEKLPY